MSNRKDGGNLVWWLLWLAFIVALCSCERPNKKATIEVVLYGGQKDTLTVEYRNVLKIEQGNLVDWNHRTMALGVVRYSFISKIEQ